MLPLSIKVCSKRKISLQHRSFYCICSSRFSTFCCHFKCLFFREVNCCAFYISCITIIKRSTWWNFKLRHQWQLITTCTILYIENNISFITSNFPYFRLYCNNITIDCHLFNYSTCLFLISCKYIMSCIFCIGS